MKKGILCVAAAALVLRLAVFAASEGNAAESLREAMENSGLLRPAVHTEPYVPAETESPEVSPSLPITISPSPTLFTAAPPSESPAPDGAASAVLTTTITGESILNNTTGYAVDAAALLAEPLSQRLPAEGPQVLIIHTHSSEAYTPDGTDIYVPTDTARTEDTNFNVVRVGDELQRMLESYGLTVLHDRGIYDSPSYTGSYARSCAAVESYLSQYPDIAVVIDLHRDALGSGDTVYKTVAELSGRPAAQVMLVAGSGESGLEHPNWRENLKLALALQERMNRMYPTLARPLALVPERYNQHLTTGSFILEVGSSGNTLREALAAVRLFGEAAGPLLAELAAEERLNS